MANETIVKRLKIISDLNTELNVLKDQYDDALESDTEYQRVQGETDELKAQVRERNTQIKESVLEKRAYKTLQEEIKEKREEIKNHKEILSHELVEYYKETGLLEVEDADGNVKKMKFSVKLVG